MNDSKQLAYIAKQVRKKRMQNEVIAKSRYDQKGYVDPGVDCSIDGNGRTKQSFKDECDINNILKKYEVTGMLTHMIQENPQYGDFSEPIDFLQAQQIVLKAEEQFMSLNAHIRNRFDNDPAKFLAFATDEKNLEEMQKLGLAKPKAAEAVSSSSEKVPSGGTQ